jgi:hypothetical protein
MLRMATRTRSAGLTTTVSAPSRFPLFSELTPLVEDVLDLDMDEVRIRSDPYAGVFFSKDRVETIIETVDPVRRVNVVTPEGSEARTRGEGKVEVELLGSGAWMSGCPEGGVSRRGTQGAAPC